MHRFQTRESLGNRVSGSIPQTHLHTKNNPNAFPWQMVFSKTSFPWCHHPQLCLAYWDPSIPRLWKGLHILFVNLHVYYRNTVTVLKRAKHLGLEICIWFSFCPEMCYYFPMHFWESLKHSSDQTPPLNKGYGGKFFEEKDSWHYHWNQSDFKGSNKWPTSDAIYVVCLCHKLSPKLPTTWIILVTVVSLAVLLWPLLLQTWSLRTEYS